MVKVLIDDGAVLDALLRSLRRATAFQVAVALVTRSGLQLLMEELSACLSRGATGELLFGTDLPTEPDAIASLLRLAKQYAKTFSLKRFSSAAGPIFHPKVWSFTLSGGKRIAVIGSSNFTNGGLQPNVEANLLVGEARLLHRVTEWFDGHFLGGRAQVVDDEWLKSYRELYKRRKRLEERVRKLRRQVRALDVTATKKRPIPRRIAGHTFAFTGKIPGWPRVARLYPRIRALGGTPATHVWGVKNADCLVHGDLADRHKSTQKLREARRKGVEVINQDQFLRILRRGK